MLLSPRFPSSKKILWFSSLVILVLCTACWSSSKPQSAPVVEYDIYTVKVRSSLALREQPSTKSYKIANLYNGQELYVTDIQNGWAKILLSDTPTRYAYAHADYLIFKKEGRRNINKEINTPEEIEAIAEQPNNSNSSHKIKENQNNDESSVSTVQEEPNRIVIIETEDSCLTMTEKRALQNIEISQNWTFVIVAAPSISYTEIFDHIELAYKVAIDSLGDIDKDHLVVFSYIKDIRLLDFTTKNNTKQYITTKKGDEIFHIQADLYTGHVNPTASLIKIIKIVENESVTIESLNWFKRLRLKSNYYIDEIIDGIIVQGMLPGDSFFHRFLWGWLLKYPYATARKMVEPTGSPWTGLFCIALLIVFMHILCLYIKHCYQKNKKMGLISFLVTITAKLTSIYGALIFLSCFIYFIPSIDNIAVMQLSGQFPMNQIKDTLSFYLQDHLNVGWIAYTLFVAAGVIANSINVELISYTLLNSATQKAIFSKNYNFKSVKSLSSFLNTALLLSNSTLTPEKLENSEYPYTTILLEKTNQTIGINMGIFISVAMIANGTIIVFGLLFFGYKAINKIATIIYNYIEFRKLGLT